MSVMTCVAGLTTISKQRFDRVSVIFSMNTIMSKFAKEDDEDSN
jgi:hypothetical protein